jgi:hypothetical protein
MHYSELDNERNALVGDGKQGMRYHAARSWLLVYQMRFQAVQAKSDHVSTARFNPVAVHAEGNLCAKSQQPGKMNVAAEVRPSSKVRKYRVEPLGGVPVKRESNLT